MQCTFDSKARHLFCFSLLLGLFLPSVLFSQQYVTNSSQSGVYETLGDSATVSPAPIYTPDQVPISTPEQLSGDSAHNCENCEDCKKKQEAAEKLKKQIGSAHKNTFFDNDFSYLNDPNYCGWNLGDAFKSFTGPRCAKLSIGGQYRARSHHERNMRGLGLTGVDDDFLLGRTRIYGDLR